jgi:hypothetical protein
MMLKHATDAGEAGQRVRHTNQRRQTAANENKGAALITGASSGIGAPRDEAVWTMRYSKRHSG